MKELVYLVDDEKSFLHFAELSEKGDYELKSFDSPLEALKNIENDKPSVIVTDILMPEMNGIKFAEKATQACPNSKIIYISGNDSKDITEKCGTIPENIYNKPLPDDFFKGLSVHGQKDQPSQDLQRTQRIINLDSITVDDFDKLFYSIFNHKHIRMAKNTDPMIAEKYQDEAEKFKLHYQSFLFLNNILKNNSKYPDYEDIDLEEKPYEVTNENIIPILSYDEEFWTAALKIAEKHGIKHKVGIVDVPHIRRYRTLYHNIAVDIGTVDQIGRLEKEQGIIGIARDMDQFKDRIRCSAISEDRFKKIFTRPNLDVEELREFFNEISEFFKPF